MNTAATFPDPLMPVKAQDGTRLADPSRAPSSQRRLFSDWVHPRLEPPGVLEGTRYTVIRFLGQGGMGEVYEVLHQDLGRRCVVKVLHKNHRDRRDLAVRMRDEARTLAALHHPNLVDVFDLGVTNDGRPFFAMDLLLGGDLRSELARVGVMAVPAALDLMCQALDGLGAAHQAGFVHRDVKLENLFLCDDGRLKVIDFGIAKVLHADVSVTRCGVAVGTPRSMAPEQCTLRPIDARTDLYAAGLALYELVTGRGPFDELRANEQAICFAHCERTPPPPSELAPQPISPGVEAAILKAISKSPENRFQSAAEMREALRALRRGLRGEWRTAGTRAMAGTRPKRVSLHGERPWPSVRSLPSLSWNTGPLALPARESPRPTLPRASRARAVGPSMAACMLSVIVVSLSVALASLTQPPVAAGASAPACGADSSLAKPAPSP
jgi:serine/threonine protein kinase